MISMRCWHFVVGVLLALAPLQASSVSESDKQSAERAARYSADLQLVDAANPPLDPDKRYECLGRHVFEVSSELEWGLADLDAINFVRPKFNNNFKIGHSMVELNRVETSRVRLREGMSFDEYRERVERSMATSQRAARSRIQSKLDLHRRRLADFENWVAHPETITNGDDPEGLKEEIPEFRTKIEALEKRLAAIGKGNKFFDPGIPNSIGYIAYGEPKVWLYDNGHAVLFRRIGGTVEHAMDVIRRYRHRKMYEIPTEPGVCVPYGFIPDDGTEPATMQMSFRYKDAPNVLYHLEAKTYVIGPDSGNGAVEDEAAEFNAVAAAEAGRKLQGEMKSYLDANNGRVLEVIGPKEVPLGPLTCSSSDLI